MSYNDPSNNPFLGRGMTSGSYDMPNYGVFSKVGQKLFPGFKTQSPRKTMDLFDEGAKAKPKAEEVPEVDSNILEQAQPGVAGKPIDTEPVVPPTDPAVSPEDVVSDPGGIPPVQPATVSEIDAQRGADLERRTRERNINLDYLDQANDVDAIGSVLEAQAKHMDYGVEPAKSLKETRGNVDGRQSSIWSDIVKNQPEALTDEQLLAGRDIMLTLAKRVEELAREVKDTKTATPEKILEFEKVSAQSAAVHSYMQGKIRTAARALNSMKAVAQTMNSTDPIRIANEAHNNNPTQRAEAILDALEANKDPLVAAKVAGETSYIRRSSEALVNYRSGSLLTGFKTNAVNLFNNTFMGGLRTLAIKPTAAGLGAIRGGSDRVYLAEVSAEVGGTIHAFTDALNQAWQTWKHGTFKNQGEYITPFGGRKTEEISENADLIGTGLIGDKTALQRVAAKPLNMWHRGVNSISFGVLTAGDDFFKTMHYRKSLYAQAIRQAMSEGERGQRAADRANELLNDITAEMHEKALRDAEQQTFTNREDVTQSLQTLNKLIGQMTDHIPLLKLWFPFRNTPMAIFDRTVKMSPLAPLQEAYARRIKAGGAEADMARAELAVGTAMMGFGGLLVANGLITGNGPSRMSDPQGSQRRALEATGWQSNSVLIGDKYTSLKRGFDPAVLPTLAIAQLWEAAAYAKTEPEAYDYILGGIFLGATSFVDNTYMQGTVELANLVTGRTNYATYTAKEIGTLVPTVGRDISDILRMIEGEEGSAKAYAADSLPEAIMLQLSVRVPGMDSPVHRYWDGTVKTAGGGEILHTYNVMSPIRQSWLYNSKGRDADPATRELVNNMVNISQPDTNLVLDPASGFSIDLLNDVPNGIELYELLLESVGQQRRLLVEKVIDSPEYQELVDGELTGSGSFAAMYLKKAIDEGLKNGKAQFLDYIRGPDFNLDRYGEAGRVISGEAIEDLLELKEQGGLFPEEKQRLREAGVKGVEGRPQLAPIEGSGSSGVKRAQEEWIPRMPD